MFEIRTMVIMMDIDIVKSPFDYLVVSQGVRLNIKYHPVLE